SGNEHLLLPPNSRKLFATQSPSLLGEDARHAGNARDRSMPSMWHESDSRRAFPSAVGSAGHDGPDSAREWSGVASATAVGLHLPFLRLRRTVFCAERNPESSLVAGTGSPHSLVAQSFGTLPNLRVGPEA